MADGNRNQDTSDLLQAFLAISNKTMEKTHVCDICKVLEIKNNGYAKLQLINRPRVNIDAYVPSTININVDDIVLVIYTDLDSRQNLKKIENNVDVEEIDIESTKHSINYGIIIMIIKKGE